MFFLRHRQACQKLRKNTTSPAGFCVHYIELTSLILTCQFDLSAGEFFRIVVKSREKP